MKPGLLRLQAGQGPGREGQVAGEQKHVLGLPWALAAQLLSTVSLADDGDE